MEERKLGVILLAAGNSKRYNGIKLLEQINGKPMYLYMLEKIEAVFEDNKVVVTQYPLIAKEANKRGFTVVINENPQKGIAHSIQLGIDYFKTKVDVDGILFSVCDQPLLKIETLKSLKKLFKTSEYQLFSIGSHGEMGNPCIIGRKYFHELIKLEGDVGGKKILLAHKSEVYILEAQEAELIDIDTRREAIFIQESMEVKGKE